MSFAQEIYQGDTGPSLPTVVTIGGAQPTDPATAANDPTTVPGAGVYLRKAGESCFSQGAGTLVVVDSDSWQLRYDWAAADTDTPGTMLVQWRFTPGSGDIPHTAPTPGHDLVNVLARETC